MYYWDISATSKLLQFVACMTPLVEMSPQNDNFRQGLPSCVPHHHQDLTSRQQKTRQPIFVAEWPSLAAVALLLFLLSNFISCLSGKKQVL